MRASDADSFDAFWKAYPRECPRKVDKIRCRQKWGLLIGRASDAKTLVAEIMAGLERWKRSETWLKDNGAFIRAPLVWLNNESWQDEPKPMAVDGAAGGGRDEIADALLADLRGEGVAR